MSDRYIPGVPCWVDATQPDPEAAVAFYGQLFGWAFEDVLPYYKRLESHPLGNTEYHRADGRVRITQMKGEAHPICSAFLEGCAGLGFPLNDDFNPPAADKIESGLEAKELSGYIALLIDQLPPRQKAIIQLKIYYNLTREQIATRLNISESSVKNQITEANKKLRKLMEDISKYYLLLTLVCLLMTHH